MFSQIIGCISPNKKKELTLKDFKEVVDPRMAAEMVSVSYIHCILKGLHKAPRILYDNSGISVDNIDVLVSPYKCWGEPHDYCVLRNIPIIVVKENKTYDNRNFNKRYKANKCIMVNNYHEAVGVMVGIKEGISINSIRRIK